MGSKEKLISRFKRQPKDFTYSEMVRLFSILGFTKNNKGATSGSRVEFVRDKEEISYTLHRPHPGNTIKGYVMKQVLQFLKDNELI